MSELIQKLSAFVEELQAVIAEKRGNVLDVQIEIKCGGIATWAILDNTIDQEFQRDYPEVYARTDRVNRHLIPHMMTFKDTPIRITYGNRV